MIEQYLIIIGSLILGVLGLLHLIYNLATNKFHAWDPEVTQAMQKTSPVITKQTTVWRAWVGFNCSHSLGVMWVPLVYVPLASQHWEVLADNLWLSGLPVLMAAAYAILAKQYWFNIPFIGSLLAGLCFASAWILLHFN